MNDDRTDDGVKVLHRMLAYIRDEALRLRIMDVALLLDHAEVALTDFAPVTTPDAPSPVGVAHDCSPTDH